MRATAVARGAHIDAARLGAYALGTALVALVGVVAGLGAVALSAALQGCAALTASFPWLCWLLPLGGLATVGLYRMLRVPWFFSTNTVVSAVGEGRAVPLGLAPAILFGTCLTDLFGGSVGKEAAALQLGGSLASGVASGVERRMRRSGAALALLGEDRAGTYVLCGMAAAFSALMFAPLSAALFAAEVSRSHVGLRRGAPVLIAAFAGYGVARLFNVGYAWFDLVPMDLLAGELLPCAAVACVASALGALFCVALGRLKRLSWGRFSKPWVMALVGGAFVVVVAHVLGLDGFWGTGGAQMVAALHGEAAPWDFAGKFALTLLVLGCGFKGGEIMPAMCMGACLGCTLGHAMGADAAACAAVGLVATLAAASNCPLAAAVLGIEAFGFGLAPLLVAAALAGFVPTMRVSLYQSNTVAGLKALGVAARATFGGGEGRCGR